MSDFRNMLDPRVNETRGRAGPSMGINFTNEKGFLPSYPRPADSAHGVQRNTVKELLMMKRQKLSCSQDDNHTQHTFKSASCGAWSPLTGPHAAALTSRLPPEGGLVPLQQMLHPPAQQHVFLTTGVQKSLFHWQIELEEQRVGGVSPELLNAQDADGDTFLHIAVAQGRRALAFVLAAKMVPCGSLDVKEHNGQTALQIAAATNQHLIAQDLLTHGAQANTRDLWGRSPLHVCAEKGHFLTLQSIWKAVMATRQPVDVEMFNYDGLTALHAAVVSHNGVVKELRRLEAPPSHLTVELMERKRAYVECIKILLLMGAPLGANDLKSGRTCLHVASEEANVELFSLLLGQPASLSVVNVKMFNGNTALHVVSSLQNRRSQVEAVKMLMRGGADPGARNLENELPAQLVPEGAAGEKVRQVLKGKYLHA